MSPDFRAALVAHAQTALDRTLSDIDANLLAAFKQRVQELG